MLINFEALAVGGWNLEGVMGVELIRVDILGETKFVVIIRKLCMRILRKFSRVRTLMIEAT